MPHTIATVGSAVGLHARPASIVAEAAAKLDVDVTLKLEGSDEEPVDAASSLLIMTLGAEQGARVVVESDDEDAVAKIAALIESDLDAE